MATILIVDGNEADRAFLLASLAGDGRRLLTAGDGAEALSLAETHVPDLVLAEILVPVMDGFELVRGLRANPATSQIRVVFHTAYYRGPEALKLAAECGVSAFLAKPCAPEPLRRAVDDALANHLPPVPSGSMGAEEFERRHLRLLTDTLSRKAHKLGRSNERLTAIVDFGLRLGSEKDPARLFQAFCDAARLIVGARIAVLAVKDGTGAWHDRYLASGMEPGAEAGIGTPGPLTGMPGSMLAAGHCFRAVDGVGTAVAGFPFPCSVFHGVLAAPVQSTTRSYGWICLMDKDGDDDFSEEDGKLARMLAAQAGGIYENGLLQAELTCQSLRLAGEVEMQKAITEAENANSAKNLFLANMSHEFRTPLGAIVGYSEMLMFAQRDEAERVQVAQAIGRNGRHLLSLINDILDLTKIEAGKMRLERVPVRPWRIIGEAVFAAEVLADEKKIRLEATQKGEIPRVLSTDPTRFRQVLDNLLSNAVKFTPEGKSVGLRISLDRDVSPATFVIVVEDEGVGMSPAVIGRLFEPFVQADDSTTRRYGGSGLGLSICHKLVTAMGGRIKVVSEPGKGSRFTVLLPVGESDLGDLVDAETAARDTLPAGLRFQPKGMSQLSGLSGHVLVAEDNPDNQNIVRFFLRKAGLTVEMVDDGEKAVNAALEGDFDFVLMDMQMPHMDGYAASTMLRERGYSKPIIALTAHAMAGDEANCLAAGCDGYLTKPLDIERLAKVLTRLSRKPGATRPAPKARETGDGGHDLEALRRAYVASLPGKIAEFRKAVSEWDHKTLRGAAHRLRGSASMYGLPEVAETAGLIEDACGEGRDFDLLMDLVGELDALVAPA